MIKVISAALLAAASLAAGAQTLLTQIPLGSFYGSGVAVNSATNRIYVVTQGDKTRMLVINGATNEVVHTVTGFANEYYGLVIDPVRNFIYVETESTNGSQCIVQAVDGRTEEIVKTITLPNESGCSKIAVDPVTGKIYLHQLHGVSVIESEATGIVDTIRLPGSNIEVLAVSPYVHRLYVRYYAIDAKGTYSDFLGFVDTITDQLFKSTQITTSPDFISFGYVTNPAVVNRETGDIFAGVSSPSSFGGDPTLSLAAYNSAGRLLADITLPVQTGYFTGTINDFIGLDVDPKTNRAFVFAIPNDQGSSGNLLYVIDGANNTVLSSVSVGYYPSVGAFLDQLAVNPDTGRIYSLSDNQTNTAIYLNVYSEQ